MFKELLKDRSAIQTAYRSVFSSAQGEIVMHHLMKQFNVSSPTFTKGDPHLTSFREGQRHVVLSMLKFISKDLNEISNQIKEHIEDE